MDVSFSSLNPAAVGAAKMTSLQVLSTDSSFRTGQDVAHADLGTVGISIQPHWQQKASFAHVAVLGLGNNAAVPLSCDACDERAFTLPPHGRPEEIQAGRGSGGKGNLPVASQHSEGHVGVAAAAFAEHKLKERTVCHHL